METMQQMELLCRQRKSKNSCVVFHFDCKDRGFVQSTKYEVLSMEFG